MTIKIAIYDDCERSDIVDIFKNVHGSKKVGQIKILDPLFEIQTSIQEFLGLPKKKDKILFNLLNKEWVRNNNPDIWVNELKRRVKIYEYYYDILICDDLRHQNEYKELKDMGFIFVRVNRNGNLHNSLSFTKDDFDYWVEKTSDCYEDFSYVITELYFDIIKGETYEFDRLKHL